MLTLWLIGKRVGLRIGRSRFQSHPRLTFQSCSLYHLNQLGSEAASESPFKLPNTCGVSNTRLYFMLIILNCDHLSMQPLVHWTRLCSPTRYLIIPCLDKSPQPIKKRSKVQVFDTPQVVNCLKVESDAALLPSWFNW